MSEYRISADAAGQRLDKYVRRLLPALPLSAIYKLIRTKKVRVNGARAEEAQLLAAGDVVVIRDQAVRERPGDGVKAPVRPQNHPSLSKAPVQALRLATALPMSVTTLRPGLGSVQALPLRLHRLQAALRRKVAP